jgi:uncharacterized membrane protein YfcA
VDASLRALTLLVTGMAAGVVGSVVSLATLISYPVLLALGIPPLVANMTNRVAIGWNGLGSVLGSRRELAGLGPMSWRLAPVVMAGGGLGAAVLLAGSPRSFELLVPVLMAVASSALLVQPWLQRNERFGVRGATPLTLGSLFAVAVYSGYFGAAGGVLTLVMIGWVVELPMVRRNALKNLLATLANLVAMLAYLAFGSIDWTAAVPLAAGFLTGGWFGPNVSRRLPDEALRLLICGCGLATSAVLAWRTYR